MIQRVQSVYLLLVTVLMSFMFIKPYALITFLDGQILNFHLNRIEYTLAGQPNGIYKTTLPVVFLVLATGLLSLVNIFLFHRRIIQLRICLLNLVLILILLLFMLIYYTSTLHNVEGFMHTFRLTAVLPIIALVMNVLAYRSIQSDEFLVNSYNRIR